MSLFLKVPKFTFIAISFTRDCDASTPLMIAFFGAISESKPFNNFLHDVGSELKIYDAEILKTLK